MISEREALSAGLEAKADEGIPWLPVKWRTWVPIDCVRADLVESRRIRKQDLYDLAAAVADSGDDAAVAGLVIAVQAWGSGIAG